MVNYSLDLDSVFSALSDPTRRAILSQLAEGESTVKQLADPFEMSLPAISKHLKVLERAGLLAREIDGRVHRCHLEAEPLREAATWIAHYRRFWEDRFDSLARYLEETADDASAPSEEQEPKPQEDETP
jgi:DNA-binding transcriptional ArsR family regulator